MKVIILSILLLPFSSTILLAQRTSVADKIIGTWLSEKKDGKVEIYKVANKYFGKLIWGNSMFEADGTTSKKDIKNNNEKLRARNMKNLVILSEFTYTNDVWDGGKIYDPESGKTYSCTMKLRNDMLYIRGFVGISLLGRTTEWTRVK